MKLSQTLINQRVESFKDLCRHAGLSLTQPRLAVYQRLASTVAHPTAEELHESIRPEHPSVSLGTVYKTLETFEKHGFITKSRSTGERARYDANLEPHHHLICKICGRMEDISESSTGPVVVSKKVHPEFLVEDIRIDFRGICGPCRAKQK